MSEKERHTYESKAIARESKKNIEDANRTLARYRGDVHRVKQLVKAAEKREGANLEKDAEFEKEYGVGGMGGMNSQGDGQFTQAETAAQAAAAGFGGDDEEEEAEDSGDVDGLGGGMGNGHAGNGHMGNGY